MRINSSALLIAFLALDAVAKGPTGIGELNIGETRSEIDGLVSSGSIPLTEPLTPYVHKEYKPTPGEDQFSTKIKTPWSDEPLPAVLTFTNDQLIRIHVTLKDNSAMPDTVMGQIAAKYGDPKIDDKMTEEQCIYKNGANFKIKSGVINYTWTDTPPKTPVIETTVMIGSLEICPANLRHGSIGPIKFNSLTIGHQEQKKVDTPNPF